MPVELCMRYQNPTPQVALESLRAKGVTNVHLIPLFPHYAMSSYETAVERVKEVIGGVVFRDEPVGGARLLQPARLHRSTR